MRGGGRRHCLIGVGCVDVDDVNGIEIKEEVEGSTREESIAFTSLSSVGGRGNASGAWSC